jgi:hypothetical protein
VFTCDINIEKIYIGKPFPLYLVYNIGYYKSYQPYKESRPRDLGRTREKMGKIYAKLFFSLPSTFIFSVVTPLHFAHLYNLISRDTSQCIKNLEH